MASIVRIAVLLLGTLSLYRPQADAYKANSNYRKDPRYGRPVLAMANSPRCMFNGRPVEDGRTVSSPEPCLNCTCSKGILLCYLRTCTTVVAAPGCQVVRRKGDCCPKLECNRGDTDYRTERTSEPSYKYRLRQDEGTFFGLIGMDPRTEKSDAAPTTTTTRKPAPSPQYKNHDDWAASKINRPSDEFDSPIEQEEDYGSDDLSPDRNDSAGNCYSKGYKYTDGMAMLSPTKCEYCYCIRGQQMCVRPKCHLSIDGCVARYQSGYTCCPSHYQCEIGAEGVNGDGYQLTPSGGNPDVPIKKVSSCNVEGYDFDVGVAVPSSGHCQTCYCTQVGVVCRRLECSPSVPGCIPVVPEGHCCPTEYKCDQPEGNETHVPISHSTENYDVTVISPSGTDEGVSSHAFETETADDINYEDGENHSTNFEDTTLDATTDKQKITVELTEDSDLESISVIPEENIAVLVLTTDKENNVGTTASEATEVTRLMPDTTKLDPSAIPSSSLKHKTKSSTAKTASTQTDRTRYQFETTRPDIITLANLKQKTRTSTTKETSTETGGTRFLQHTTKPAIELINLKHKTKTSTTKRVSTDAAEDRTDESTSYHSAHDTDSTTETSEKSSNEESYYNDEEKDNYAYDYVELYEDVTHDEHETFVPFSDYTETTYGGILTPSKETGGTISNTKFKVKNKRPSSHTQYPTTQTITSFTNAKFATDGLKAGTIAETETVPDRTAFSTFTNNEKYTNEPTSYTIYSTTSDKTHRPYVTESTGRHKQKTKPNTKPIYFISTEHEPTTTQHSTPPHSLHMQTSTRTNQINEYQTTSDQKTNTLDITEASRPPLLLIKQHNKIISNHKQRLPKPPQPASPHKSTKPLPQDIATLLLQHITQKYSPQTQDASTETYDISTKQETLSNKLAGSPVYSPDTSTFVIAAPKLIVEDVTEENEYETSQYDTTNTDITTSSSNSSSSGSPLPSFNFQSPEIIFSNHGPSPHNVHDLNNRKQPTKVHDPNNHHKQPTKIHDPNNHHMQPTKVHDPNLPVLINNHKKTSTRIRPPIRFKPPSTPSVPQTSFVEISNHRPINSFRRPPSKFPPYPSYNLSSETEYRVLPNPRDPLKLHRIVPDSHPEWREDYDEYYYDLKKNRNPSTKVFTNFQDYQTTGTINVKSTVPDVQSPGAKLQPTTRKNDLNTNPATVASREEQDEVNRAVSETSESTIKTQSQDDIAGRSSDNKITETTYQTTVSTTPFPTTILNIATSTNSFSRDPLPDDEGKLFRAEDNKDTEASFTDPNKGQYKGKPNKFEVLDGRPSAERPVLKPFSIKTSSAQAKEPPQSEEDSKEINDVCFIDGRYYNSGEIIVKSNPCEMCRCFYGHPLCQVQQCPSPPEPSCVLEYLPGYCCPRVTCGVKMDSSQSSSDVSVPDPTSQEIRPPLITLDNQWKPLPHGPVLRPMENIPKIEAPSPERIPEVVTLRPFPIEIKEESKKSSEEESALESENIYDTEFRNPDITISPETPISSTFVPVTTTPSMSSSRTTIATTRRIASRTTIPPLIEVTTYFPELPITTSPSEPQGPIFDPESEKNSSQKNKSSDIHDNSSGVRKILDETVTLPPSKVSLSPSGGENISTVLPVIQTLPTVAYNTESPLQEVDTVANFVLGDVPAELGGNLKVSGCNVYGKYYKINDVVTALSKPCSDCICSTDGIACNASC